MRVAMLSPGPSLVKYPVRDGYDLVVGVNRVPFKYECDWWSLADDTAYIQLDEGNPIPWGRRERVGNPRLFVKRATIGKLRVMGSPEDMAAWLKDEPRVRFHDECLLPPMPDTGVHHPCGSTRWDKFGGPTALCLCWLLGGKEVDVYGADMGGFLDSDGIENRTRHDGRWKLERVIWTLLVEGFTNTGMTIRRIL